MSDLTDQIARAHKTYTGSGYLNDKTRVHCDCGWSTWVVDEKSAATAHIAEVTEAAVREQVAQDIGDRFAHAKLSQATRLAIRMCQAIARGGAT